MMDNKAAFSPAIHSGLGKEFVAVGGWREEARLELNDRNTDDTLFLEETVQRQASIFEEGGGARVKPHHVLGSVNDAGGTAFSILDDDAFLTD
jgi:hypothetical protein